jgi:hypothetical protein
MAKVSVVLDDQQQAELKMILVDQDAEAAMVFLKEIIWDQIQAALRLGLRSHLEKGAM